MPAQMVHLAVARNVLKEIKCENEGLFYLGNISPDAIHERDGMDRADKSVTHFTYRKDRVSWTNDVIAFYSERSQLKDSDFYLGYAAHVLTDICWLDKIFKLSRQRYFADINPIHDKHKGYYNDLVLVDYELYLKSGWKEDMFSKLKAAVAPTDFNLLSSDEINSWRDTSIKWFDVDQRIGKTPLRYMMHSEIEEFIKATSDFILEKLANLV